MMRRRDFLHCSVAVTAALATLDTSLAEESKPKLQFADNGKFKIAQFTDTHYRADRKSDFTDVIRGIGEILDAEKPQLAIYTGDIVTAGETKEGWNDILAPCIERKIPYAVTLGNHDDENTPLSRREIIEYISGLPFSVTQPSPESVFGAGNCVLEVFDGDRVANLVYCLDSNGYPPQPRTGNYHWIQDNQIVWFKEQSDGYTRRNDGKPIPALAFFHIPLNEFGEMIHHQAVLATERFSEHEGGSIIRTKEDSRTGTQSNLVGQRFEMECSPAVNSGMFYAMWLQKDVMGILVGHEHTNNYIGLYQGIALAYGHYSGRSAQPITPGARIVELSKDGGRSFTTWIRQRGGGTFYNVQMPDGFTVKNT